MKLLIVATLVAVAAAQTIPTNLQGNFVGTLSFLNQIFKGFDNRTGTPNMAAPIYVACCAQVYTEPVVLTVTRDSANFTSPGATGQCGPSLPGFIEFTGVTRVGTSSCYQGMMNLNGILKNIPGKFQLKDDFSVKLDVFAAITDFATGGMPAPFNNCPYDSWDGAMTSAGLPCVVVPQAIPTTNGTTTQVLASQALYGRFTLNKNAGSSVAPSLFVLAVAMLAALKL
jgi:hypothetical protein